MPEPTSGASQLCSSFVNVLTQRFVEHVHQILAWGYAAALPRIKAGVREEQEETSITGFIAAAIDKIWDHPDTFVQCHWCKYYYVREEPPLEHAGKSGRRRPRADLVIAVNGEGRAEFIFEAKRLRRHGFPASKYISSDGMGCFIDGRYAAKYERAGMLGYIQSDSAEYWRKRLQKLINENSETLCLHTPQQDVYVRDDFDCEWTSQHARDGIGAPIRIYHILLDCIPIRETDPE